MEAIERLGWHRVAAIGFLIRAVAMAVMALMADLSLPIVAFTIALNGVLAIGYWIRNVLALAFGLYAALTGILFPVVFSGIAWPRPWMEINLVLSVMVLIAAFMAWRTRHAEAA